MRSWEKLSSEGTVPRGIVRVVALPFGWLGRPFTSAKPFFLAREKRRRNGGGGGFSSKFPAPQLKYLTNTLIMGGDE